MSDEIDYEKLRRELAEFGDAERAVLDRLADMLGDIGPIDDDNVDIERLWHLIQPQLDQLPPGGSQATP